MKRDPKLYKQWNTTARSVLVGRTITKVMYMDDTWADTLGFTEYMSRPLIMQLDNGMLIIPLQDDEGNGGGALEYIDINKGTSDVLPVM